MANRYAAQQRQDSLVKTWFDAVVASAPMTSLATGLALGGAGYATQRPGVAAGGAVVCAAGLYIERLQARSLRRRRRAERLRARHEVTELRRTIAQLREDVDAFQRALLDTGAALAARSAQLLPPAAVPTPALVPAVLTPAAAAGALAPAVPAPAVRSSAAAAGALGPAAAASATAAPVPAAAPAPMPAAPPAPYPAWTVEPAVAVVAAPADLPAPAPEDEEPLVVSLDVEATAWVQTRERRPLTQTPLPMQPPSPFATGPAAAMGDSEADEDTELVTVAAVETGRHVA